MKVTEIEVHPIMVEHLDWIASPINHYSGPSKRTVYVAHTDNGLVGLGEGSHLPQETIDKYIGTNPFDWMGDDTSIPLGTAMYDLMGKAAGVPCYNLFGQKYRSWIPVSSWTVSTHPDHMAEAVRRYSEAGYTWLKFHLSPFENVFDQTEAMQAVGPEGFRIHYDFTGGGTDDHMPVLLEKLSRYPIAGCFEDPLADGDLEAARDLRQRINLPILRHRAPLNNTFEVLTGAVDGCIEGHGTIATAMRLGGLCAAAEIPYSIQHVGGTITRAKSMHMQAATPTGYLHCGSGNEILKSDVVTERLRPINGFARVPETPGLGVTLDRKELERLAGLSLPDRPKWIIRSRFANGTRLYAKVHDKRHFMIRPDWTRGGVPMSHAAPITTEYWDDDGSPEFVAMWKQVAEEGMVLEGPSSPLKNGLS